MSALRRQLAYGRYNLCLAEKACIVLSTILCWNAHLLKKRFLSFVNKYERKLMCARVRGNGDGDGDRVR